MRNGKQDAGVRERERDRERDRDRDREREREWVPRESAQQHHREQRESAAAGPIHPRDMPPGGPNAAMLNTPPLAESGSGGSFLSRIGGPYRSPPTASNSFRSDIGEQRSWPEDDWDGPRKRTLSGAHLEFYLFYYLARVFFLCAETRNNSFQTGRKTLWKTCLQGWPLTRSCPSGRVLTGIDTQQAHRLMA